MSKKEKKYFTEMYEVGGDLFRMIDFKMNGKKIYKIFISQSIEHTNEYTQWETYYQTESKKEAIAKFESIINEGVAI